MIDSFTGANSFLSNFHRSEIVWEGGLSYPTVEHAFQATKTLNLVEREQIRLAKMPGDAKRMGRTVVLREGWSELRLVVMEELLRLKFSDPALGHRLLATGKHKLVEGNSWGDQFWGVCRGKGQNHLGLLLMKIRAELASLDLASLDVHVDEDKEGVFAVTLHERIADMQQYGPGDQLSLVDARVRDPE
jgi:ribA/ribD-fused uncharacterized protein